MVAYTSPHITCLFESKWGLTKQIHEVVENMQTRVKIFTKLTNLDKKSRIR